MVEKVVTIPKLDKEYIWRQAQAIQKEVIRPYPDPAYITEKATKILSETFKLPYDVMKKKLEKVI